MLMLDARDENVSNLKSSLLAGFPLESAAGENAVWKTISAYIYNLLL
jgi:hypothetical protein